MINWELQSKTHPQSLEDGHIHCILLIRIAFCHESENLPLRCLFDVTMNIYSSSVFCVNTAHDVVTILLIFAKYLSRYLHIDVVTGLLICAKYLSLYLHIFTCTYRGTHTQAHVYNQHTTGMATTRHTVRSMVERGGRKSLLETLHTPKKNQEKRIFTNLKKKIQAHRASSNATRLIKATSINMY